MEPILVIPKIDTSHDQAYYATDFLNADMPHVNFCYKQNYLQCCYLSQQQSSEQTIIR